MTGVSKVIVPFRRISAPHAGVLLTSVSCHLTSVLSGDRFRVPFVTVSCLLTSVTWQGLWRCRGRVSGGGCQMSDASHGDCHLPPVICQLERIKPIERLVPVSFTHCCASTPGLSTWWSSTALGRDLVLRGVSRLDAFSGYPVRT